MRFVVSPPSYLTDEILRQIYMCGIDRVPFEIHARRANGELILERVVSDSGSLHIPWPIEGAGPLVLSTGTLIERPEPYYLPLELARGKLGQVRNQQAEWGAIGLVVPDSLNLAVAEATEYLGKATQAAPGSEESVALAERAIHIALTASSLLVGCYVEQALAVRHRQSPALPTLLGANLGPSMLEECTAVEYVRTFNAANVPILWRDIETSEGRYSWDVVDQQMQWSRRRGLRVLGGPLIHFDQQAVPDWLCVCSGDFDSLLHFASEFVQAAVLRYRGKVDGWICASRVNTGEMLSLSEEEKVRLSARTIELTHALDPDTPTAVSFDQPWAEYLSYRPMDFPPLHFADALVRAGLGLTAIGIEINVGYHPGGTLLRDPLDLSRQLDYWGSLGVPLYVFLTIPSGSHEDPLARRPVRLPPDGWNPLAQQSWAKRYLAVLLAKPYVQAIMWEQLRDSEPHEFPHGGLFDPLRRPKPALRELASFREAHLM